MSTFTRMLVLAAFASLSIASLCGCKFYARSADEYRKATRDLLETKNADIKSCYDAELKKNMQTGKVVVHFTVESETGKIKGPTVYGSSTAPAELGACVVKAIDGLTLDPPDKHDGDATFTWEFQLKS